MLLTEQFVLSGPVEDGGLRLVFKRYLPQESNQDDGKGHALIFAHSVGTHKEIWEPTIEHIFSLQASTGIKTIVREVWSVDALNHGQTGIMNEEYFSNHPEGITAHQWAHAIQFLLESNLIHSQSVIGIGHSAGACAMVLSTTGYPDYRPGYSSIILVDPPMMTQEILAEAFKTPTMLQAVMDSVKTKRDIWPSRDSARDWLRKRLPWSSWDPRVLDLFVTYGLRDLPTTTYPDYKEGVTLSCTRAQETAGYVYHQDGIDSLKRLSEICPRIPVHCILGNNIDLVSEETHRGVCNVKEGRQMSSITKVPGAGHLVVQEAPEGVAAAIWQVVSKVNSKL